jgi:hypothetical protein
MSDRKYRQHGYQDSDRPVERRPEQQQQEQGPRERPEGPRGRGLGAPTETVFRCRICGTKQRVHGVVPFEATCSECGNDLHTCSNCVNFDTSRPHECRKQILQRVESKSKRNACQLFTPNTVQEFASDVRAVSSDPRAAFDALFRKK